MAVHTYNPSYSRGGDGRIMVEDQLMPQKKKKVSKTLSQKSRWIWWCVSATGGGPRPAQGGKKKPKKTTRPYLKNN
jgi:hypothetical protein